MIPYKCNGKNILIADTPDQFCRAIVQCFESFELRCSLGNNARVLATDHYDMSRVGERVFAFYQSLINNDHFNNK